MSVIYLSMTIVKRVRNGFVSLFGSYSVTLSHLARESVLSFHVGSGGTSEGRGVLDSAGINVPYTISWVYVFSEVLLSKYRIFPGTTLSGKLVGGRLPQAEAQRKNPPIAGPRRPKGSRQQDIGAGDLRLKPSHSDDIDMILVVRLFYPSFHAWNSLKDLWFTNHQIRPISQTHTKTSSAFGSITTNAWLL